MKAKGQDMRCPKCGLEWSGREKCPLCLVQLKAGRIYEVPPVFEMAKKAWNAWHERHLLRAIYGDVLRDALGSEFDRRKSLTRVLDIGCGIGSLSEFFDKESYFGIDIVPARLHYAKMKNPNVVLASAEDMPFSDGVFDLILGFDIVHHVDDRPKFLREVKRTLRTGGTAVFWEPYLSSVGALRKILVEEDTGSMFTRRSLDSFLELARTCDFEIVKIRYRDFIAYPLSGGYGAHNVVPLRLFLAKIFNAQCLVGVILSVDRLIGKVLGQFAAWKVLLCLQNG